MESLKWNDEDDDKVFKWVQRIVIIFFIIGGPLFTTIMLYWLSNGIGKL